MEPVLPFPPEGEHEPSSVAHRGCSDRTSYWLLSPLLSSTFSTESFSVLLELQAGALKIRWVHVFTNCIVLNGFITLKLKEIVTMLKHERNPNGMNYRKYFSSRSEGYKSVDIFL